MDYEKMDQELNTMATAIYKAVANFLDKTDHVALPIIEVDYSDCSAIGALQFQPNVKVRVTMEAIV